MEENKTGEQVSSEAARPDQTEAAEDKSDLESSREELNIATTEAWWKTCGPGLITGAADDDPSGIGTYSVAGAQYGYLLLWLIPFCIPFMIAVQEMCGRIGVVTGKGLTSAIKDHYPRWILYIAVALLVGANVTNIYADLNVMASSAQMLFKGSFLVWVTGMTLVIILLLIYIPYRIYVKVLKWLCLALLAYVVTAVLPASHNNWGRILHDSVVPGWKNNPEFVTTVVGILGTTISPYLFFWQASQEVEEEIKESKADAPGKRRRPATDMEMRRLRSDTMVGMISSQLVAFFIIICTASNLHGSNLANINTAQDAAKSLLPLGQSAYWLFALGILGAGALAIPTLAGSIAYAVAESADWRYGLFRRFARAKNFYSMIVLSIVVGYIMNFFRVISPIHALFYSAVLNGIIAPPLIVILLLICNNRKIFGDRCNSWLSNIVGILAAVVMSVAIIIFFWEMIFSKH